MAACSEILSDPGLTIEKRVLALFNRARGAISIALLRSATDDLNTILVLDPQSAYAASLQAEIAQARKSAEGLLHCLPKAQCQ